MSVLDGVFGRVGVPAGGCGGCGERSGGGWRRRAGLGDDGGFAGAVGSVEASASA